jgi:RNase H-like domain found in reverse transcriptase
MEKFLGMLIYIGKFIPIKAELLVPLRETVERTLNKKENKKGERKRPEYDAEAMAAFETIKELITNDIAIVNPKWDEPVEIYTDASDCGIGGVIRQKHGIIAYYSKTLKENEKGWSTFKKELYAILKTIEDNINLLKPHTPGMIKIFCDNKGVVELLKNTNREKTIEKNAMNLFEQIVMLDLTIAHIPGKENTIADALSRYSENVIKINKQQQKEGSKMNTCINKKDKDHYTMDNAHDNNTYEINSIVTRKPKRTKRLRRMDKYFGANNLTRLSMIKV